MALAAGTGPVFTHCAPASCDHDSDCATRTTVTPVAPRTAAGRRQQRQRWSPTPELTAPAIHFSGTRWRERQRRHPDRSPQRQSQGAGSSSRGGRRHKNRLPPVGRPVALAELRRARAATAEAGTDIRVGRLSGTRRARAAAAEAGADIRVDRLSGIRRAWAVAAEVEVGADTRIGCPLSAASAVLAVREQQWRRRASAASSVLSENEQSRQ